MGSKASGNGEITAGITSQAASLPPCDPSRELTDREMDLVATNLDKVFRRRRPTRLPGSFAPPAEPAPDDAGL